MREAILSGLHNFCLCIWTTHWCRKQVCICHQDEHSLGTTELKQLFHNSYSSLSFQQQLKEVMQARRNRNCCGLHLCLQTLCMGNSTKPATAGRWGKPNCSVSRRDNIFCLLQSNGWRCHTRSRQSSGRSNRCARPVIASKQNKEAWKERLCIAPEMGKCGWEGCPAAETGTECRLSHCLCVSCSRPGNCFKSKFINFLCHKLQAQFPEEL